MEYTDEEVELTEILIEYWGQGRVSGESVKLSEDEETLEILWHYC